MNDLADLVTIAQQAVGLGYDLIKNTTPSEIRTKGDRDVVTEVDIAVEQEVRAFLARMTPDIGFLGEEEGGESALSLEQDVWVLDPVDGTSNFAHGLPLCAISLALARRGESVVAAIVAPFLDLRYYAVKDQGAFGNGSQLQVSTVTDPSKAIVSIGDYAVGPDAAEKNEHRIQLTKLLAERVERVRMFGSAALDLAWVAEGRTDATLILSNEPWDTAAGVLIAREAGALVADSSGTPHDFTSAETIALSPGVADELLSILSQI